MASNKTLCFSCATQKLAYPCKGCGNEFCFLHLKEHQQVMMHQLKQIVNQYDQCQGDLKKRKEDPDSFALIEQIDQWERITIETIRKKAKKLRRAVVIHTERAIVELENKLNQLAAQLTLIQEENEVDETDLRQLEDALSELTREQTRSATISLPDVDEFFKSIQMDISVTNQKKTYSERSLPTRTAAQAQHVTVERDPIASLPKKHFNQFTAARSYSNPSSRSDPSKHRWNQHANVVAGENGSGHKCNQLTNPCGIFVDQGKNIYIADSDNHRAVRWESKTDTSTVVAGGNEQGARIDQLNEPTDLLVEGEHQSIIIADRGNRRVVRWFQGNTVQPQILIDNVDCYGLAIDKEGFLYVSVRDKHEVRRWKYGEGQGIVVAGGNKAGSELTQLDSPSFIAVDAEQSVYVSDSGNQRVVKWPRGATEGTVVAGGNERGKRLDQLSDPAGVIVDCWGQIYVTDYGNDRVVRWRQGESEGEVVVGENGRGKRLDQLCYPVGLSFDDEGALYVSDLGNHRILKYDSIVA